MEERKVLVFGRTGSGKSTIAQMLTHGELLVDDDHSTSFQASSSARGKTRDIVIHQGGVWHATDTPGFGEVAQGGTLPTKEAANIIVKERVRKVSYFHVYDERLWKFFNQVFAGAVEKKNFTVFVTNCDEETHIPQQDHDETALRQTFSGCERLIYVSFPPIVREDDELENENREIRRESLDRLERKLKDAELADWDVSNHPVAASLNDESMGICCNWLKSPFDPVQKLRWNSCFENFVLLPQ
jgi:GTPase SAR1 family protein